MTKPLHRARSESHRTCALILTSDWRLRRRLDTVARRRVRRRRGRGGRPRGQGRLWSRRARPRSTPPRARAHARAPCTKNSYDVHETVQRAKCQFWPCTVIGFSRHPLGRINGIRWYSRCCRMQYGPAVYIPCDQPSLDWKTSAVGSIIGPEGGFGLSPVKLLTLK